MAARSEAEINSLLVYKSPARQGGVLYFSGVVVCRSEPSVVVESSDALQICDEVVNGRIAELFWLICSSSDSTWQAVSVIDPKPNHTTDRYQVIKPNGVIRVKAILPSRPNDSICYRLLAEPCSPRASIPCNWNIVFANSIHTVVLCIRVPLFVLTVRVGCALIHTYCAACEACAGRRLDPFH